MAKSLSHLSDEVTQQNNAVGQLSPILTIEPENGTRLRFLDSVPTGEARGLPIIADLQATEGPLPTDTELIFRVVRPTDDSPVAVSVKEDNIAAWNGLSTKEQRNEENIDAVKVRMNGNAVNVRDKDVLRAEVRSSKQIDWSNSEFYIPREGVEEKPFSG
ncbi:hypothetical protein [Halosimplex sp. J119]